DGIQRALSPDMLMICDGKGPVALAGIMGGLESEIEDDTRAVLIESAYFDPISIRRTAKRLGLNTESSFRFERGVDPEGIPTALDRAAKLMVETAGGKLTAGVIDNYPRPIPQRTIDLSVKRTNRLLGMVMNQDEISSYLTSVQLDVAPLDEDRLRVVAPSFRVDLKRPEDLMEEVARLKGYDQIPTAHPRSYVVANPQDRKLQVRTELRQVFAGCGFSEVVSYSFIAQEACDRLQLARDDPRRHMVSILNPLTEDQAVMRTSLIPGLLAIMYRNSTQQNKDLRIFEIGKIFLSPPKTKGDELPEEVQMISGLWTGARHDRTWHVKEEKVDFYDIKGVVESVCAVLSIQALRFAPLNGGASPYLRRGHAAKVYAGDEVLGEAGELTPEVLKNFELKHPAFCFDLNFDRLVHCMREEKHARLVSRFPATTRDMALIVDNPVEAQGVLDFIDALGQALITGVDIFDVYEGPPVPQGKKSIALRLTYQSFERSLTDSEVNSIHETMTDKVLENFNAQLPPGGGRSTMTQ
ncbi:MAG: phenylalanine--tRNA ligase subunit beta, partial [Deltaproteobacteria bacterium]